MTDKRYKNYKANIEALGQRENELKFVSRVDIRASRVYPFQISQDKRVDPKDL
jgi:hypothetical protein